MSKVYWKKSWDHALRSFFKKENAYNLSCVLNNKCDQTKSIEQPMVENTIHHVPITGKGEIVKTIKAKTQPHSIHFNGHQLETDYESISTLIKPNCPMFIIESWSDNNSRKHNINITDVIV